MDLYEEAEYHTRRNNAARQRGGSKLRDNKKDGGVDDLPMNSPPKNGLSREEFREWKQEQLEIQQERIKAMLARVKRTEIIEKRMDQLKELMGDEYDSDLDKVEEDEDEDESVKAKAQLPSVARIQALEQRAQKILWLKQKMLDVQQKAQLRAKRERARFEEERRQAGIEAEQEEESEDDDDSDDALGEAGILDLTSALAMRQRREQEQEELEKLASLTPLKKFMNTLAKKASALSLPRGNAM